MPTLHGTAAGIGWTAWPTGWNESKGVEASDGLFRFGNWEVQALPPDCVCACGWDILLSLTATPLRSLQRNISCQQEWYIPIENDSLGV